MLFRRKNEILKKKQFNTKYGIPNVLRSITCILAVFLKVNIFNQ